MKKISMVLFAFLFGSVFTSCLKTTLSSSNGITWTKYSGNPFDLGVCHVTRPWVIYDGHMFKMWYEGQDDPYSTTPTRIYLADSTDGVNWTPHGIVLDEGEEGSWDNFAVGAPTVIFDGTTYKMWYLGCEDLFVATKVGYATSSDGINWIKYGGNPVLVPGGNGGWDDYTIGSVSVFFNGTHYIMWYGGYAFSASPVLTGVATSVDGISWTKHSGNPVLVPGPSGWDNNCVRPGSVIMNGSQYVMWYVGQSYSPPASIGIATSPDGFSWSKYEGNPVLQTGPPGSWDSLAIGSCCVVERNGNLLMFYGGYSSEPPYVGRIGLATSYAPYIQTKIDFDPDCLNLKSKGKWITAYIELPEGYDVADINVSTIVLNGTVPAESRPTAIGDYDGDGVPDLMVKFDRAAVVEHILNQVPIEGRFMTVTLTITGELYDGTQFQGSDALRIIPITKHGIVP